MSVENNGKATPKKIGGVTGKGFQPGQSGNPGGKGLEREQLRRYILETHGKDAIDGIAQMARSAKSEKVKLAARVWLAEQSVGRALVAVSGEDGKPLKVDVGLFEALERLAKPNG